MEVVQNNDTTFIICDDTSVYKSGSNSVCIVDKYVYEQVKKFVELFEPRLQSLLHDNRRGEGTSVYWEDDYNQKIVDFLKLMMPEHERIRICNALCALGY